MLRPCQWLEGTDIIKAAAPHWGERGGGTLGLSQALITQLCGFFLKIHV